MSFGFMISYIALWTFMLVMVGAVFILYRYLGSQFLGTRDGHMRQGPALYKRVPPLTLKGLHGETVAIARPGGRSQLVIFASLHCPSCAQLMKVLPALMHAYSSVLDVLFVCEGTVNDVREFTAAIPHDIPVLADARGFVTSSYKVAIMPYALTIDQSGVLQYKGVPPTDLKGLSRFLAPVLDTVSSVLSPTAGVESNRQTAAQVLT